MLTGFSTLRRKSSVQKAARSAFQRRGSWAVAGKSDSPNRQKSLSVSGESRCRSGAVSSSGQWAKFRGCGAGGGPLAGVGGKGGVGAAGPEAQKPPFHSGSPFPGRPERDSARSAASALPPSRARPLAPSASRWNYYSESDKAQKTGFYTAKARPLPSVLFFPPSL